MTESSQPGICSRIADLRLQLDGPRGKAAFAKKLNISPSTYDYYESARIPPADVLVKIADLAGVDLRWLLTGASSETFLPLSNHPAISRAGAMLAKHPDASKPLEAFLDLLSQALKLPAKGEFPPQNNIAGASSGSENVLPAAADEPNTAAETQVKHQGSQDDNEGWIPVIGRSAAGMPQFWDPNTATHGLMTLDEKIKRTAGQRRSAKCSLDVGENDSSVQIVTLREPGADNIDEFISAPSIKARYPDAMAVRIDGESMSPEMRHGDLVVICPSAPALNGKAAIVQLEGQIGVTCKLYRVEGDLVHLVPINEHFAPQAYPLSSLQWALRIIAKIQPS